MLRRCASCGRVAADLIRDDFLDGWVCEECPEQPAPDAVATIAADIATLTARLSEAETTAAPTAAAALQEARRHVLRAAVVVELAQEVSG